MPGESLLLAFRAPALSFVLQLFSFLIESNLAGDFNRLLN